MTLVLASFGFEMAWLPRSRTMLCAYPVQSPALEILFPSPSDDRHLRPEPEQGIPVL